MFVSEAMMHEERSAAGGNGSSSEGAAPALSLTQVDRRALLGGMGAALLLSTTSACAKNSGGRGEGSGAPDAESRAAAQERAIMASTQQLADRYVRSGKLPGVVIAVGRAALPVNVARAGVLALGSQSPVDGDSLYRIYSMTKIVTAMAAMQLIEDGKMKLDQNIADFLPAFAQPRVLVAPAKGMASRPARGPITIRQLLTHTSGLTYTVNNTGPLVDAYLKLGLVPGRVSRQPLPGFTETSVAPSLAAFADRLATLPLLCEPGTQWHYSVSLDLMGRVIEVVSGQPFERFVADRLLTPLGMVSTGFQVPQSALARMTSNYLAGPMGLLEIDPGASTVFATPPAFAFGGSGLVSSARDFDRFMAMLLAGGALGDVRVMKPETVALATSNLLSADIQRAGTYIDGQGFGAGGVVTTNPLPGGLSLGSYGWSGAAGTRCWIDPVRRLRVTGMVQFMPDSAMPFSDDLVSAVYQPGKQPAA